MKNKIVLFLIIALCFVIEGLSIYNYVVSFYYGNILDPIIDIRVKRPVVDEKILNSLGSYLNLKTVLLNADIDIPLIDDFIPQGIEIIDDLILITGYYESNSNSKCFVIDKKGNIKNIVELDSDSHVGAISYDKKNDLLWVPGNDGLISAYDKDDFLKKVMLRQSINTVD